MPGSEIVLKDSPTVTVASYTATMSYWCIEGCKVRPIDEAMDYMSSILRYIIRMLHGESGYQYA